MQELGRTGKEFEYESFVSADGTKLHAQRCKGKNVITGVNERYEEMKENHDIKATVVGMLTKSLVALKRGR